MDKAIDYVIAVAECGSISKAAEFLYISQPSLSRFISKLENELGLRLFLRSIDGITLTEAGEVYVSYAKEIRRLQSTLDRKMYQMKMEENSNHICVCMTLNTSSLSTWRITEEFHKKYPECQLEFMNVMSRDIQNMLDEEKCDFAIGPDVCDNNLYTYKEICRDDFILLVPAERYNLDDIAEERADRDFKWLDLSKIPKVDYVLQEKSCNVRKLLDQALDQAGVKIKPRMEFTNSILAIQAAEQQVGCCFISGSFLPYIAHRNKLRYYCVGDKGTYTASGIICGKEKIFTHQEKHCLSLIKRTLIEEKQKHMSNFKNLKYD